MACGYVCVTIFESDGLGVVNVLGVAAEFTLTYP